VTGASEAVSSKLFDEAVRKSEPALTLRCEFPGMREGDYTLRLVVRQPETSAMTKINRALTL
jgi:hypothetical protein